MFGLLLGWYSICRPTFSGALALWRNFVRCKIHFTSNSCIPLHWQRYCTALQQQASAKLCGVVHGMELRNFRRGRHLYLTGRLSRWASAHILVFSFICISWSELTNYYTDDDSKIIITILLMKIIKISIRVSITITKIVFFTRQHKINTVYVK